MKLVFSIVALIFLGVSCLMHNVKEYSIMITALIFFFIAIIVIFADKFKKHVKKAKLGNNELEFNTEDKTEITSIAFELLESNFPKLTTSAQREVEKRIKNWTTKFIDTLHNSDLSYKESKVLYDPDFQFVFNKAIEIIGRKNDKLLNDALTLFLIERIKYHNSDRPDLISQIDETIINDIKKLTENHFKLMCLVKLLEDVKIIIPNVNNINDFKKYVIGLMGKFCIYDFRCYEDLKKTNFIHNGGNEKLLLPNKEDREFYDKKTKPLKLPPTMKENLWEYFSDIYPFIKYATETEKQEIIENDIYKICDKNFKIFKMILLLPFATKLINNYGLEKMREFYMEIK